MSIKITKCPPGEALGARDLQRWAAQRLKGGSGVPLSKRERKLAKKRAEDEDATARWLRQAEARARRSK
jgi:hypothetical protein